MVSDDRVRIFQVGMAINVATLLLKYLGLDAPFWLLGYWQLTLT